MKNTAVLLLSTPMPPARKGVVAAISQFLIAHNGSVLHSDDHLDSGRDLFLSRLEWDLDGFDIPIADFSFRQRAEPSDSCRWSPTTHEARVGKGSTGDSLGDRHEAFAPGQAARAGA